MSIAGRSSRLALATMPACISEDCRYTQLPYEVAVSHSAVNILWIYVALLVAGGLIGFIKAKSKMSLIMSLAFAVPLAISVLMHGPMLFNLGVLGFLSLFFGMRFAKSKKMMPAGAMTLFSVAALASCVTLG